METQVTERTGTSAKKISNLNYSDGIERIEGTEKITREEVKGTPFIMVNEEGKEWFLAMGQHRMTEKVKTKKELEKKIGGIDWNLMMTMIAVIVEKTIEMNKTVETLNQPK